MTPLLLRYRPCFEPLVWTVNDETGGNEPDLGELAEKCEEQGCDPYCTPGPSQVRILSVHLLLRIIQVCVKYIERTGEHLSYTSQVTLMTTGLSNRRGLPEDSRRFHNHGISSYWGLLLVESA